MYGYGLHVILISQHIDLTSHRGHNLIFHGLPFNCITLCPLSHSGNVILQSTVKGIQPIPTSVYLFASKPGYKYPISMVYHSPPPTAPRHTHAYAQCTTPEERKRQIASHHPMALLALQWGGGGRPPPPFPQGPLAPEGGGGGSSPPSCPQCT